MQVEQTPLLTIVRPAAPTRIGSADAGGLPDAFLVELLLRHFSRMGEFRLFEISQRLGVEFDTEAVDFMIDRLHPSYEQAYLPCIPYDVISKIRDRARYLGQLPRLTLPLIKWAWKMYFGVGDQPQQQMVRCNETEEATK